MQKVIIWNKKSRQVRHRDGFFSIKIFHDKLFGLSSMNFFSHYSGLAPFYFSFIHSDAGIVWLENYTRSKSLIKLWRTTRRKTFLFAVFFPIWTFHRNYKFKLNQIYLIEINFSENVLLLMFFSTFWQDVSPV